MIRGAKQPLQADYLTAELTDLQDAVAWREDQLREFTRLDALRAWYMLGAAFFGFAIGWFVSAIINN